jgi:hypothetical protein
VDVSGGYRRRWAGIAVPLVVALFVPAAAAADTITFEERTAGQTVNAQYSSQGVTFNGPVAYTYPAGFAHSGTKAVEFCRGVEFCGAPPIRADFTTGQTTVGVWVGNNDASQPRTFRMTAFDQAHNELGHQDATVPAGSPVNTHLTFTAGGADIFRLEVAPADSLGSYDMVVDDVEFTAAGPPPPCSAQGVPTINLTSPTDQTYVQNNSILLKGSVDGRTVPITDATVVSEGSTTRTAIGFPTPIDADGGSFAINMNGLLQLGNQKVFVTATNCAGTGVSANPIVVYNPLPPTAGFQQIAPVEVVQTVQGPFNPVPLVAGPNGTKRTIARVFLSATGVTDPIANVSGQLVATRPDGSQLGGPLRVDSLNTITVGANRSLSDARRLGMNGSLNFELPSDWIGAGRLHLQLEHLKVEGEQSALPCQNCDNYGGQQATQTFHSVPPARIWLIGVPYTTTFTGTTQTFQPRQKDFDFLASWLRRAYPTADVQITQSALPAISDQPSRADNPDTPANEHVDGFDCDDVNSRLDQFVQTLSGQPAQTKYYGLVSDASGLFMRGCSNINGRTGSGPAGCCSFGWDTDSVYTDWYGGHEIGHMYDRKHPDPGCKDSDDDSSFPFAGGHIGDTFSENQGVDVGDASLSPMAPLAVYDWPTWTDVMTYCDNEWLSSYTYNGILRNLCNNDRPNCPDRAQLTRAPAVRKRGNGPRLAVQGEIDLNKDRVKLDPMSELSGLTLTERPKRSRYAIVLRDERGKVIRTFPFEPKEVSDQPPGVRRATIDEVVPFAKRTARIQITGGGKVLASRVVTEYGPVVDLRSLASSHLTDPLKLRWRAHDGDRDRLLFTVQYAADGRHYVTLAAGLRKRKLRVDPATLPGGDRARFRVIATDGVLTNVDRSERVSVPAKPPRISVATPVDGAELTEGQSVQLVASVSDGRDQHLADSVTWSSDLQGDLGRGAPTVKLQPGSHTITATVTDSLGLTSTATVHLQVEAIPPTVDAQLTP